MNTRIAFCMSLVVCVSAAAAWSQDVPPPPPTPAVTPGLPTSPSDALPGTVAPAAPSQPVPGPYYPPPGPYSPPPGAVMLSPGQPYPYPPPGPYGGPMVVSPPMAVLVPAPPLPSYDWSANVEALFLERSSGGSIPLGYTFYNRASQLPPQAPSDQLFSDDQSFPLEAGLRLEISRKFDNLTLAATYWGLQQWSVGRSIYGDPDQQTVLLYSPYLQLPTLLSGLDNSLGYTYGSQIQNVEVNALFRLNPSEPYWEVDWLWGARYVVLHRPPYNDRRR